MSDSNHSIEIVDVTDATELAEATQQREQFDRNSEWLQNNITAVYSKNRGKWICIAGQELFVGDSVRDVVTQATAAHPDDAGWFTRFIPTEKLAKIYAVRW